MIKLDFEKTYANFFKLLVPNVGNGKDKLGRQIEAMDFFNAFLKCGWRR